MALRHYSDFAQPTTLAGSVATTTTPTVTVTALVDYPSTTPWVAVVDSDSASEELLLVTGVSGTTLTVTRNYDGHGAFTHLAGASFAHVAGAIDYSEANTHVNSTTGVHGVSGSVVGTTDTQTLSNKTLSASTFASSGGAAAVSISTDTDATHVLSIHDHLGTERSFITGTGAATVTDLHTVTVEASGLITAGSVASAGALSAGAASLASNAVSGNETVGGTLGVIGNATFGGNVTVTGAVTGTTTLRPGDLVPQAHTSVPAGRLACDGSAVSRTTYAALFAKVATVWGAGDGSTTFNLPNLNDGSFIAGGTPATAGGSASHSHTDGTLTVASHAHTLSAGYAEVSISGTPLVLENRVGTAAWNSTNTVSATGQSGAGSVTAQTAGAQLGGTTDATAPDVIGSTAAASSLPPFKSIFWTIQT